MAGPWKGRVFRTAVVLAAVALLVWGAFALGGRLLPAQREQRYAAYIPADAEAVYRALRDPAVLARVLPWRERDRLDARTFDHPLLGAARARLLDAEPGRRLRWLLDFAGARLLLDFSIQPLDRGSHLEWRFVLSSPAGVARWRALWQWPSLHGANDPSLWHLRRHLEEHPAAAAEVRHRPLPAELDPDGRGGLWAPAGEARGDVLLVGPPAAAEEFAELAAGLARHGLRVHLLPAADIPAAAGRLYAAVAAGPRALVLWGPEGELDPGLLQDWAGVHALALLDGELAAAPGPGALPRRWLWWPRRRPGEELLNTLLARLDAAGVDYRIQLQPPAGAEARRAALRSFLDEVFAPSVSSPAGAGANRAMENT